MGGGLGVKGAAVLAAIATSDPTGPWFPVHAVGGCSRDREGVQCPHGDCFGACCAGDI